MQASKEEMDDVKIVRTAFQQMLQKPFEPSEDLKSLIIEAVSKDGLHLQFATTDLRKDKEVVRVAVQQNTMSLKFAMGDLNLPSQSGRHRTTYRIPAHEARSDDWGGI